MSIFDVFKKKEALAAPAPAQIQAPTVEISGAQYSFSLAKSFRVLKGCP